MSTFLSPNPPAVPMPKVVAVVVCFCIIVVVAVAAVVVVAACFAIVVTRYIECVCPTRRRLDDLCTPIISLGGSTLQVNGFVNIL